MDCKARDAGEFRQTFMKYQTLLAMGRAMDAKQIADSLKGLAKDPRFAAVLAVIDKIKEETADASCDPKYANGHGTLEHAAGVRNGLQLLEARFKNVTDAPKRTGQQQDDDA